MKRRDVLIGVMGFAFFLFPLLAEGQPAKPASRPSALTFGTSSVGGSVYVMSVGMTDIISKKTGINISTEAVGGSTANVRAMKNRKIDIGMLGSWTTRNGFQGTQEFAKEGKVPFRVLLQGQASLSYLVVRNDSGIKTPADLRGKKFMSIRPAASHSVVLTYTLFETYGIRKEDVQLPRVAETGEMLEALKIGTVPAALIPGGIGASNLVELARTTDVTFLALASDKIKIWAEKLGPAFRMVLVPANTYKGQNQDVYFPADIMAIVVLAEFPEETAYLITKTLLESTQELAMAHSVGKEWNVKATLQPPPVPFHPGAIRYFKEKGLWNDVLEREQARLLRTE